MKVILWTLFVLFSIAVAVFIYSASVSLPDGKVEGIGNWTENVSRIESKTEYSFAFIGDVNNIGIQDVVRYLCIARDREDVSFVVLGGDFYRSPSEGSFRYALAEFSRVNVNKPILTVPGNHDLIPKGTGASDPALFEKFCGAVVRSFSVGNDLFLVCRHIGAEKVTPEGIPGIQPSATGHKVVLSHAPWFNFGAMPDNFRMGSDVEAENAKLAKALGAEIILCGHVDRFAEFEKDGIRCVVAGGGPSKDPGAEVTGMVVVKVANSGITFEPISIRTEFDFPVNLRRWLFIGPASGLFSSRTACVLLAVASFIAYVFVCKKLFYDKNIPGSKN